MNQSDIDKLKDRPDSDILTIFNLLGYYRELAHDTITKHEWVEAIEDEVIHRNLKIE